MIHINLFAIMTLISMGIMLFMIKKNATCSYYLYDNEYNNKISGHFRKSEQSVLLLIFLAAIVVRVACAAIFEGHPDVNCFKYWGNSLSEKGFSGFYSSEGLTDYLPGYLYILRIVEAFRDVLGLDYYSTASTVLYKMPAIIFDIALGFSFFKIARKKFEMNNSIIISCLFLFNPLVILNSAVWGQIDSILSIFLVWMCYLVYKGNLKFAYILYGLGFLVKPQMAIFTPILLLAMLEKMFISYENDKVTISPKKESIIEELKYCIPSIIVTLLLCVPFGVKTVIKQCFDTMSSYEYATVNAYNFWGMLGLDWASQDDYLLFLKYRQWSTIFIVALVMVAIIVWFNNFKERSRYIVMAILLGAGMFTLSVRMHERYIFPAIILMILLFIVTAKENVYRLFAVFSVVNFYNTAHVLFFYDPYNFDGRAAAIVITSVLQCIVFGLLCIYIVKNYIVHSYKFTTNDELIIKEFETTQTKNELLKSIIVSKFTKRDLIIMTSITLIYGAVAFYNLGDTKVPQTTWERNDYFEYVDLEFPDNTEIVSMDYYLGNYEERHFKLYESSNGYEWNEISDFIMDSVFRWGTCNINTSSKYLRLEVYSEKAAVNEIVFKDAQGNSILPINYNDSSVKELFDEQDLAVLQSDYSNGTIFDEIYHARTGYEFNNGLYTYEWTHPPLGKVFISLGMKMFGTSPFGWRFAGTLFGVLMLPFMYIFGKLMFKSTAFASLTCLLMACDFMHFTQSRIATIDVFVTFFVILMYVFMYRYYQMSFYDTKLTKTFVPLALCGISMGLGCASKWTGVYAGLGLAVIFFYVMYLRYSEYRMAKKDPKGVLNGIKNSYIIENFSGNFWKTILFCVLVFVIVPGIIYTLSYIPFVGGADAPTTLIGKMLYNQKMMFNYHKDCIFEHPYSSRWYEWALMLKPILYYSGMTPDGSLERISAFGNPMIWWIGIIAFIYMLYRVKCKKDRTALFLVIGYLAQMIPWTLVVRTTFIYHYFTSVPFVILMNAYACYCIWKKNNNNKKIIVLYAIVVVVCFVIFYPALSGAPMKESYDNNVLRWINGWYV